MQILDKDGWPVEFIKTRPIVNFLRFLIHTREIKRGQFAHTTTPDPETASKVREEFGNDR